MGTYAGIYRRKGSIIPENKKEEFTNKIEKVFMAGGMMDVDYVQLYGKTIKTISKAKMQEKGLNVYYNYFEDDFWENVGFNREEGYVWSNKIGWNCFHRTVVAAYVLEEQYIDGVSITKVDDELVTSWAYVGWLNYLFDEKNHIKNFDSWKLFEEFHYSSDMDKKYAEVEDMGDCRYAFIAGCEICAVLEGYENAIKKYSSKEKGQLEKVAFNAMLEFIEKLNEYINVCNEEKESQLQLLMKAIRMYYETDEWSVNNLFDKDDIYNHILTPIAISDAPAFAVKVIAEKYNVDFWELWDQIRGAVKRKAGILYGNEEYYVLPISTEKFFRQAPDDMIIYWEEGCDLEFSSELKNWFKSLKMQYENLLKDDFYIENQLFYVMDLLEEANENYHNIYVFNDFFEETLNNLQDKMYWAVWKIFDSIVHNTEMEHNKTRVNLRRYMALMGNKELRYKVFGF